MRLTDHWTRDLTMAFIVTDNCIKCKYTDCVAVCPVDDCFREGENFLVIDPEECIDCGACVPECPTEAIFSEDNLPEKWVHYREINERYAQEWPTIAEQKDPLPDAEEWKGVEEKADQFDPAPVED